MQEKQSKLSVMGFRFLKIVILLFVTSEKPFAFHVLYKLNAVRIKVNLYLFNIPRTSKIKNITPQNLHLTSKVCKIKNHFNVWFDK